MSDKIYARVKCEKCKSRLILRREIHGALFSCENLKNCNSRYSIEHVYRLENKAMENQQKKDVRDHALCTVSNKFLKNDGFYLMIVDNGIDNDMVVFYNEDLLISAARGIVEKEGKNVYVCDAIVTKVVRQVPRIAIENFSTKETTKEYVNMDNSKETTKETKNTKQEPPSTAPSSEKEEHDDNKQYEKVLLKLKKLHGQGKDYKKIAAILNECKYRTKRGMVWNYNRVCNVVNQNNWNK